MTNAVMCCPWCHAAGSEIKFSDDARYMICPGCGATGPRATHPDQESWELWNELGHVVPAAGIPVVGPEEVFTRESNITRIQAALDWHRLGEENLELKRRLAAMLHAAAQGKSKSGSGKRVRRKHVVILGRARTKLIREMWEAGFRDAEVLKIAGRLTVPHLTDQEIREITGSGEPVGLTTSEAAPE